MDNFEQLPLYDDDDIGAYRYDDPDTSYEAAHSVKATELEAKVRDAIFKQGDYGATGWEVAAVLKMSINTVSPRFAPLRRKGFIYDSGERRPGPSGRNQIVWKIKGSNNGLIKKANSPEGGNPYCVVNG